MTAFIDSTSSPSDVAATPPQVASSGAPVGVPSTVLPGRPGQPLPLPKQGRGGDVRHAPFPPVRAVDHLTNVHHPVFAPTPDGGEAA